MTRPIEIYAVSAIMIFFSVLAFPTGYLFITDPTGASMGIEFAIQYLPVIHDFLPVGIFLLTVYGVAPLIIVYGLLTARSWAWTAGVGFGAVAVLWILLQVFTMYQMGFIFFQPLIAGLGLITIYLLNRRNARKFLKKS